MTHISEAFLLLVLAVLLRENIIVTKNKITRFLWKCKFLGSEYSYLLIYLCMFGLIKSSRSKSRFDITLTPISVQNILSD